MPPLVQFLLRRTFSIVATLVIVTAVLYGVITLAPPEKRAALYLPKRVQQALEGYYPPSLVAQFIREYGLNDPFPVQYLRWASRIVQGDWGWSPLLRDDVFHALTIRTPMTAELTLYSLLLLVPLGLVSGVTAAARRDRGPDHRFRLTAFVATSIPPFVLAFVLLSIFYVGLRWFPPGRLSPDMERVVNSDSFQTFTGLLTIDGLLNGRADLVLDALRHLALPILTLSVSHWATLGRVTRALMIEELDSEYVTAARARGLPERRVVWQHALRNALAPALTNTALTAASLVGGVYIVEAIFDLPGISDLITGSFGSIPGFYVGVPDATIVMGFAVYTILVVLAVLLVFDILQLIVEPRLREGART